MKCPKCHFENPADIIYCGKCGTRLPSSEEISISHTKTIQTPLKELTRGTTFAGRYEVIEELGKGGMGRVYRVEDKKIKEEIALKLIKPEIALDKKTIERFSNELKIARQISHRNVCRMYGLDEEEGTHYITMEYVPGEDLKSFIRRSRQLSSGTALSIAKQVCEGLAEAHRLGVVHRDLKPQNIMIDKEGNARIMDFGIARSLKGKGITGAGVMIGTPEYMSPEQVEGKEVDQRSDIYSLGVILYEMVTGRVPFEGDTPFTIGIKHKSEIPQDPRELNAQIPLDLSRLILKCMEKDKEKRYQSAEEVLSELINIERGMPTTEREIPERKPLTSREITVKFTVKKMFVPGVTFLAAIIIGLILWQLLLHKEKVKPSLAILSFENQTGNKTYDYLREVIPNLLITNLEQSGNLQIMTWERMSDLLEQMGKKEVKNIDKDLGFDLARLDGIDAIVLGSFTKAGNIFATDVKVLDVETKKLLKGVNSKGEGVGSILKNQIDELSKEISRGVGIPKRRIEASKLRIAEVTTNSLEAYKFFLRGREDYEKFYYDEARTSLEKAVGTDSTFASAYLWLARVCNALGDEKTEKEAYEKAKAFSTKATDKERLYIEASYAGAVEKDAQKRFRLLKQLAEKYPKEERVHYDLAAYFRGKKMFQEALEEYQKALELDPSYGYALNDLGYLYSDMGNYEKAIECFKKYAALSPEDANPLDSMAELYFRMGRLDEAIAEYKKALKIKADFSTSYWRIGYIFALNGNYSEALRWVDQFIPLAPSPGLKAFGYWWKAFYYSWLGRLERSLNDLQRTSDLVEAIGFEMGKAWTEWLMGWVYYEKGELELSQKYFQAWFNYSIKSSPGDISYNTAFYNFHLGLIDLKQARLDSAKSRLAKIKSLIPEIDQSNIDQIKFLHDQLQGEVLLAEGSVEKAITVLEKASPLGKPPLMQLIVFYNIPFLKDELARAYQKKGEIDKAISEYVRLITFDPTREERCLIHPKYYYRLAKLYEEKGWKGKAIENHQKFLSIWKDADPRLPAVIDAKKRLAVLQNL